MILIADTPFDSTELLSEYPKRSIEHEVLTKLTESSTEYRYDFLEQLKFELALRRATVEAAVELSGSGFGFAVFHDAKCNEDFWDKTENGGFKLKEGVLPADAIRDIFEHGSKYATECATGMMIVFYGALLDVLSEDIFNQMFPGIYLMDWFIRHPILDSIGIPEKMADILIGDRGYFANPDVDPKTPEWQGENVIILPDDKFYGHGVGITKAENIIKSLNSSRIQDATQSAHFMDEVSRPDFKALSDTYEALKKQAQEQREAQPEQIND